MFLVIPEGPFEGPKCWRKGSMKKSAGILLKIGLPYFLNEGNLMPRLDFKYLLWESGKWRTLKKYWRKCTFNFFDNGWQIWQTDPAIVYINAALQYYTFQGVT
jgi:hypothetical protein